MNIFEASVYILWYISGVSDDAIILYLRDAQISSGKLERVKRSVRPINIQLNKRNGGKHKTLVPVVGHDVFVKSCFRQKSENKKHIQVQFRTANMEYDKRPITKFEPLLYIALKFV